MLTHTEAQIYLGSHRGCTVSEGFRSFLTLNFGKYSSEGRQPFGRLVAFNEQTLAAGKSTELTITKPTEIVLLPIAGGLELVDIYGESTFVSSGESFHFLAFPESSFSIINPYAEETINYLEIHFYPDLSVNAFDTILDRSPLTVFSLDKQNVLIPIFSRVGEKARGFLGQYGGRMEDEFEMKSPERGIFVFIVQGAFEVQNRLLEKGDALSLLYLETLEFEALSEGAIILVVEVG